MNFQVKSNILVLQLMFDKCYRLTCNVTVKITHFFYKYIFMPEYFITTDSRYIIYDDNW